MSRKIVQQGTQVLLVTVCGVFTAYSAWAPEFQHQAAEQRGEFKEQHNLSEGSERVLISNEATIGDAIRNDLRDAKEELTQPGGFAWGIRQALFGKGTQKTASAVSSNISLDARSDKEENPKKSS